MLTLYRRLFFELEQQGAEYAVWKNVQELPEALQGSGDIDLYVYPHARAKFVEILRSLRFVRATSHKSYPYVEHYYGFDAPSGKFAHLHIYFQLVTGESHIKQYVVPIEPYLNDFPAVCNAHGIYELHPLLLKKLNIFRRKIKLSCLPGAVLFFRERRGYQQEKELTSLALRLGDKTCAGENAVPNPAGWLGEVMESKTIVLEVLDGFRYRVRYQQWNRFKPMLTPFYRYFAILTRLQGKLVQRKKRFPIGLTVAISHGDFRDCCAHEDSLADRWLAKHFSVRRLRAHQPHSAVAALLAQASPGSPSLSGTGQSSNDFGSYQVIRLLWEAWRWRSRVRRTVYWSTAGFVVFWNPVDATRVQQALAALSSANADASLFTQSLLRVCTTLFKIEPSSNIVLLVTSSGNGTLSGNGTMQEPIKTSATPAMRDGQQDVSARIPALQDSARASGDCVFVEVSEEPGPDGTQQLNCALWETIAELQY